MTKLPSLVKWVHIQAVTGSAIDGIASAHEYDPETAYNEAAQTSCKKMLRNIKGIIFDFDGTIFDFKNIAFNVIAANPFDLRRIWIERTVRKRFAGRDYLTPENYYRAYFKELAKASLRSVKSLRNWYFNKYMPRMARVLEKHYCPREGFDILLKQLENPDCPLQAAVYSDYPFLEERMEAIGLSVSDRIRLYTPGTFGAQKPAVRPFLQIAKDFKLSPEEILVIGDREDTDGLGAFNAGMRYFCLETGRKRYFRLDPNRRPPKKNEKPHGPILLMYAGKWENLFKLLMEKISK